MYKKILILPILMIIILFAHSAHAMMSSTNYRIDWDTINSGGSDNSTSTNYSLTDSFGQLVSGEGTSINYNLVGGYQQQFDEGDQIQSLFFTIGAQNNNIQTTYSAFNSSGFTVTVVTSTGFSVDDRIGVIENYGGSELVAIGKITEINDNIITVDKWSGDQVTMNGSPVGGDDFVYNLNGNILSFTNVDYSGINTALAYAEVKTTVLSTGYSIYIKEDTNLKSGTNEINDVVDGVVTANNEEYGIETVGDGEEGAGDWAITGDKQPVSTGTGEADNKRIGVIHKFAVDSGTPGGNYQHTVSYYCTVNY